MENVAELYKSEELLRIKRRVNALGFRTIEAVLNAAALGFLGLGVQAPYPEWGTMLSDAKNYIQQAPWLMTIPGICLLLLILSTQLISDGLRDQLDPKLRNR